MKPELLFHPAVADWFDASFSGATTAQAQAWPAIKAGEHVLVAAPTGSGKTLAAFLASIDTLVHEALDQGGLPDETQIVYVSPLKALSNDIQKNLDAPLSGIRAALAARGLPDVDIRTWVRTGDTPQGERDRARRTPPHIVVTTPESLYILLGSESGRKMLSTTKTIIVDEIHAMAANKRGTHLAVSLERLEALCGGRLQRVGLSATQKPIEDVARFLSGKDESDADRPCRIVDIGHHRKRLLTLELPQSPLEAVMSNEVWEELYQRLTTLIEDHRTTLIFVNTRRLAERVTKNLSDKIGKEQVATHHGSLSKEIRLDAEQRLKHGKLRALVATASLELGIDIGDVDLVCQIGSPRSIASFLQRVGRSGHAVDGLPKGGLFPLSRDEMVECASLLDSVRRGELDQLVIPQNQMDVLAQQIVAESAARDCGEDELYDLIRRSWPFRSLDPKDFIEVVRMLAEGFSTRRGRRGALIHYDAVNRMIRGRKGARLTAITSGGTIPDNADFQVLLEPENHVIGSVNEDFAVESLAGDIFQLGNHSYRILRVEKGQVRVEDAHGMPPTIPFWLGEAPGRSDELSQSVSRLREKLASLLAIDPSGTTAQDWLVHEVGLDEVAADQIVAYLGSAFAALGLLPTHKRIVLERFFDEAGGMQLVVHSPYGSRINRAWGLALRKRFCRKFNFELQAAATEDNIILSLSTAHSFELSDVGRYLHSNSVRDVLTLALLDAPMFETRWRWVAGVSLALPRFRGGKKIPPQIARMNAEDLISSVFPDQIACAENLVGEREIPDHPLVNQTIDDCLNEAMDINGLERLLKRIEAGEVEIVARDLTEPSPLALEVLAARPYAFLDDAPLEERRTQAVMSRRWLAPEEAADIGKLDPEAIARVRLEAWPEARNADELHDALVWLGFVSEDEAEKESDWKAWLAALAKQKRVAKLNLASHKVWITAERLSHFRALWPEAKLEPIIAAPTDYQSDASPEEALVEILRGRLEGLGPVSQEKLAAPLGMSADGITAAILALEGEGFAMRGHFSSAGANEWCERRLLARIHQYTVKRLRAEIEPVAARDFLRFLFSWQRIAMDARMEGPEAVDAVVGQLEGFETPASAWESEILPARIGGYEPAWLDDRCLSGHVQWTRLRPNNLRASGRGPSPVRSTPITLLLRRNSLLWSSLPARAELNQPGAHAQKIESTIREHGALFFPEIVDFAGLLRSQVEEGLAELVALGLVTSDSFGGLRALFVPSSERRASYGRRRRAVRAGMEDAGRWALTRRASPAEGRSSEAVEHVARRLLDRYGVVFWRLLEREANWLPPWRELLRVYRRLESRGEIRGGRFVAGFTGEQFAVPEAIGMLRKIRREEAKGTLVSISGADPLNLVGILTPGARLPALTGNRLLYRDGVPIATLTGSEVEFLQPLSAAEEWEAHKTLLQSTETPYPWGDEEAAPIAPAPSN